MNNAVIVSGGEQRDLAIHTYVSILPETPFPTRLPHNIEQSCLCSVGPYQLSILNTTVCGNAVFTAGPPGKSPCLFLYSRFCSVQGKISTLELQ